MTKSDVWDLVINFVGLCGIACLAVPAQHVNKYARAAAKLASSKTTYADPAMQDNRQAAIKSLRDVRDEWQPWKGKLLILGTVLAGLSYAVGILKSILV